MVYHVNFSVITVHRNKEVTKINPVVMAEKKQSYQLTKMHKIP